MAHDIVAMPGIPINNLSDERDHGGDPFNFVLKVQRSLSREGFRLVSCAMQAAVRQVFEIARLDHTFSITPNVTVLKKVLS